MPTFRQLSFNVATASNGTLQITDTTAGPPTQGGRTCLATLNNKPVGLYTFYGSARTATFRLKMTAGQNRATLLFWCNSSAQFSVSVFGPGGATAPVAANPLDQLLAPNALTLSGVDPQAFNPVNAPFKFTLTGASFNTSPGETSVRINNTAVAPAKITITNSLITVASALQDGRNDIRLKTIDTIGRPLYHTATVWAGSSTLTVTVRDVNGATFTQPATVTASLTDDQTVAATLTTSNGIARFVNMPVRTILIEAKAAGNRYGLVGAVGSQGSAVVQFAPFNPPSAIDNNDFSQGAAGWIGNNAAIQIVPHVEGIPGAFSAQALEKTRRDREAAASQRGEPRMAPAPLKALVPPSRAITDNDLMLGTVGEGEQSLARTFTTEPGTTGVVLRYRFITSEVPGGYFGSQYNDYYRVSIRSQKGGQVGEANSMNGLGLGAFDFASGATAWREVTLKTDPKGDTIQADIGVANVADDLLDSQVVIDFIKEIKDQVKPALAWDNINGGLKLTYTVENGALSQATTINVHFASGTAYANRIGNAVFSLTVPQGTAEGQHGPVNVPGNRLAAQPDGTTHLLASSSETRVASVPDVRISYGAQADSSVVSAAMTDAIKDSLRAAGQAAATISSTARTPEDQARAMFNNLVNPQHTISQNIAIQHGIYAAAGDAVINTFAGLAGNRPLAQVLASADTIQASMVTTINAQGPQNVSRHCADSAVICVVDVGSAAFNATNGPLFVAAVRPRVDNLIDERTTNSCYHLEKNV